MPQETLIAFALFALVASITPGPNNLMLLASGVNFGFRSTIPHMLGICFGFLLMIFAAGFGLAEVFAQAPWIYGLLKWAGTIYMLYLAWCIATSVSVEEISPNGNVAKPISFWSAAAFQWVNPKAWVMTMSAFSMYVPASSGASVIATVAVLFLVIGLPSMGVWALCGSSLRHVLQVKRNLLAFNYSMAALLVASLYPVLYVS